MRKSKIWSTTRLAALILLLLVMTGCGKGDDDNDDLVSYDLSALIIDNDGNLSGTVKVTKGDKSVTGETVTLSYRTHGGNGTATSTDIVVGTSNSMGQVAVSGTTDKTPRVIHFTTDNYTTHKEVILGTVPAGFLTGQASERMDLDAAREYCKFHGGRLPLIGNAKEYPWSAYVVALETKNYATVDGFGRLFATWPTDVPVGFTSYETVSYWTDSEDTDYGDMWLISPAYNDVTNVFYVASGANFPDIKYAVICIP